MFKDYYINDYFLCQSTNRIFFRCLEIISQSLSILPLVGWKVSCSVVTVFHLHQRLSNKLAHTGNQQHLRGRPVSCLRAQGLICCEMKQDLACLFFSFLISSQHNLPVNQLVRQGARTVTKEMGQINICNICCGYLMVWSGAITHISCVISAFAPSCQSETKSIATVCESIQALLKPPTKNT